LQYEQITNFNESALDPTISPDGRMLAFLAGPGGFGSSGDSGQIFVKLLPDGDPVQLTRTPDAKQTLHFSPDGSRVAYTDIAEGFNWNTWEVPVTTDPWSTPTDSRTGGCAVERSEVGLRRARDANVWQSSVFFLARALWRSDGAGVFASALYAAASTAAPWMGRAVYRSL